MKLAPGNFGLIAGYLVLDAIELDDLRHALVLGARIKASLSEAMNGIVADEFKRNTVLDTGLTKHSIDPKNQNVFRRLNDGLVEILGAVSGCLGTLDSAGLVLIAALRTSEVCAV